MAIYGPKVGNSVGTSTHPKQAVGSHNFQRSYFRHAGASGDVRVHYEDLDFTSTGSGETYRIRAIANGTLCATGGTINAIHATGRVASAKTVSGSLNAIRATLEVAGTTPTPGGKLAALRVDSNISTGWTDGSGGNAAAFIAAGNVGAGLISNLFSIDDAIGTQSATTLTSTVKTAATNWSHGIKINVAGTTMWLMATTTTPAA
jgi:hypothetical protein